MTAELFNFDYSRWEIVLLSLLPAFINIIIFFYSYLFLDKTRTVSYFSLFALFFGLWQLSDGFMKMSQTIKTVEEWNRIGGIFILMTIPFGIQFILSLAEWNKNRFSRIISLFLFTPVFIFSVFIYGKLDSYSIVQSDTIYWIVNPKPSIITLLILSWIGVGALAILLLFWLYFIKSEKNTPKKRQALLLAAGFILPVFSGIIFEILFPIFFGYNSLPMTAPLLTIFSITSLIAIKKYKMFGFSPKHQWDRIVESMNEGLLIVDNEDRIHYANETFCNLLGYKFNEIKGKVSKEVFLDNEQQKKIGNIIENRKVRKTNQYEIPLITKENKIIWMLVRETPYLDRKGKEIGFIGILANITHLKETEKTLKYNEARLNQAQEVANIGSWEISFSSKKAVWSDEACRMYGISPKEKKEQSFESWISFIHPDDLEGIKKEIERSEANLSESSFKHRIILRDGNVKHIHTVGRFEFDDMGYPVGLFGICHDITEQVKAEKALFESEENMRIFINESLMSIYFVDPKTKQILYSNPALSELLGYTQNEFKMITPYEFVNHTNENIDERIQEVMKNKKLKSGERQWKRKDGKIIHVLVSSFYHKRNGTDAIYIAAQNITDIKIAEEKLKATNLDLKTFIYKSSHDIRGPLATIMGLVNVSKLELKESTSVKYLDMIDVAAKRLDYMLGELVKAMEIKDVDVFTDKIDFNILTEEILEKFLHFPGYSRLKVDKDIVISESFFSNKSIIETILRNLVENAIKYQKTYGVEPFLKIRIMGNNNDVKIIVEDNGIGIEESIHSRIYDMYFRGNDTINGSGLGLYLVKKGTEKLNGEILLESQPDLGCRFTILLPTSTQH
jgi:PAS domain S-box-containing protein